MSDPFAEPMDDDTTGLLANEGGTVPMDDEEDDMMMNQNDNGASLNLALLSLSGDDDLGTALSSTETDGVSLLESMPYEILFHIASFLSAKDVVNLGMTCQLLNEFCDDDYLWKTLVLRLPQPGSANEDTTLAQRLLRLGSARGLFDPTHEVIQGYQEAKKDDDMTWKEEFIARSDDLNEEFKELLRIDEQIRYRQTWEYSVKTCCDTCWSVRNLMHIGIVLALICATFTPLTYYIMMNMKLDGSGFLDWTWTQLLLPIYVLIFMVCLASLLMAMDEGLGGFHTCCVSYATFMGCAIAFLFPFLCSLKVDKVLTDSWVEVFTPVYIMMFPFLCTTGGLVLQAIKKMSAFDEVDWANNDISRQETLMLGGGLVLFMSCMSAFVVMLPLWLDGSITMKLSQVFIPIWILLAAGAISSIASCTSAGFYFLCFDIIPITWFFVALVGKLELGWQIYYTVVLAPYYFMFGASFLLGCGALVWFIMQADQQQIDLDDRNQRDQLARVMGVQHNGVPGWNPV